MLLRPHDNRPARNWRLRSTNIEAARTLTPPPLPVENYPIKSRTVNLGTIRQCVVTFRPDQHPGAIGQAILHWRAGDYLLLNDMAAKSNRIAKFRITDPVCYFCATRETETEDHVPSRECFRDRIGPEGFTFPACKPCNNNAGQLEQVVALYMTLFDHTDIDPSTKQITRLLQGVANNNRELLPSVEINANAARRHYRSKGLTLSPGEAFGLMPIATLPPGHKVAFELFGRRLACALYYKETGKPLPLDYYIVAGWLPWQEAVANDAMERMTNMFPTLTLTNRTNTDIGPQFSYKWGEHPTGSIFGFVAQFSQSFIFLCAVASPELHNEHGNVAPGWKVHADDVHFVVE